MKILIIINIILCLIPPMLVAGCSHTHNQALTLWKERQMEDDRRLYGNPYDSLNRQKNILSLIPLIENSFTILFNEPWEENLRTNPVSLDSETPSQDDAIIESQSSINSQIFTWDSSSVRSSDIVVK